MCRWLAYLGAPIVIADVLVVSEPLELHWSSHTWLEVPPGTIGIIRKGESPVFAPIDLAA